MIRWPFGGKSRFHPLPAAVLVLCLVVSAVAPALAQPSESVKITGDGVAHPLELTRAELEAMEQYEHVYSTVNTWPTKKWYRARGVKLRQLLALAGIKPEAKLVRFVSADGYEVLLTVKQLLSDKRYYFPGLKENHPTDGSIPGSSKGAVEVEPILALVAAEGSEDPEEMNDRDALLLVMGQRAVTEQTNTLFLKYVSKIEVLTTEPEKWDSPKANIPSGMVVPKGTAIRLSNKRNNEDKIHYTTDGSTPTVNSPMYNWCASRWWPLRDDLDSVNRPIVIEKDTVIKAVTIGPGREDSEVVTFTYTVDPTGRAVDPTTVSGGPPTGVTLDRSALSLRVGSSFQLAATIEPFNADDQRLIWSSSDTRVATVDNRGLVTVVGPGTATITVRTAAGGYAATCVVSSSPPDGVAPGDAPAAGETGGNDVTEEPWPTGEPPAPPPAVAGQGAGTPAETSPAEEGRGGDPPREAPAEPPPQERPEVEPEEERPVPEGMQYLARKEDLAAPGAKEAPEQPSGPSPQVFEVSIAVPATLPEEREGAGVGAAAVFLVLLLSGAAKTYVEYAKER
ncbi:MAG: FN3 associated domain-containing protein [Clostridia bacterium]|nr:FN3 associated domain-containing protein [Clostridia bacterium]